MVNYSVCLGCDVVTALFTVQLMWSWCSLFHPDFIDLPLSLLVN